MLIDYPLNKINYTSSRGPASDGRVKPDVTAPGGMIFSAVSSYSDYYKESSANTVARATINGKSYYWGQMTGTSQASPFVAGVIATWLEANPELSPEDIQLILKKTARQDSHTGACPNSIYGYGKIDALAGIKEVLSPSAIDNLSTDKLYKLYRDGILFTSQAGKINLILSTPDGIIRYSDKTDVEPGTRIERTRIEYRIVYPSYKRFFGKDICTINKKKGRRSKNFSLSSLSYTLHYYS